MTENPRKTIEQAIKELFQKPSISEETARSYLSELLTNLTTTETDLQKDFGYMIILILGFLLLDSSLIKEITVQGMNIQRNGLVMIIIPVICAFLYYQAMGRVFFIHELRTAISIMYGMIKSTYYMQGLDMLTQYASFRNIESYQGRYVRNKIGRFFYFLSTAIVTICLFLGPLSGITYLLYRSWFYTDLPRVIWIVAVSLSSILSIRSLFMFGIESGDGYVRRSAKYLQIDHND